MILTGAGAAFCAGMDTDQFGGDLENRKRLVETSTLAFESVGNCKRPVIAAVNGPALAGGFALALLYDLRVATTPRNVRLPRSFRAGSLPATRLRARCSPRPSRRAVPDGTPRSGREAQRMGIVREVVAQDVVTRATELATRIAGMPRRAILETKRRTLLERSHLWGFLFEEEQRVFRRALLGEDAGEENGEAA